MLMRANSTTFATGRGMHIGRLVTWIAILAPLPYTLSRVLWAVGVPVGISAERLRELDSPGWGSLPILGLALLAEATALFVHAFVLSDTRTFPRWVPVLRGRPVRPRLVVGALAVPIAILAYANAITAATVLGLVETTDDGWGVGMTGAVFWVWGLALAAAALGYHRRARALVEPVSSTRERSLAWAAYAATGWALAYAIGVRGYHAAGGTAGLAGTFEDPGAMRSASLLAGIGIALVGLGALALVRPWGLRLPRWLIIVPALTGSAYAIAHALTAYVTKPLHAAGVIDLEFHGWASLDEAALIRWDLLFYEPWFLGLGVLVTLGALHHYRRTGGSWQGARRLLWSTVAAALALTTYAFVLLV